MPTASILCYRINFYDERTTRDRMDNAVLLLLAYLHAVYNVLTNLVFEYRVV